MMTTVHARIKVLRPLLACGERFEAGTVAALPALDAASCVAGGRAVPVSDADWAAIVAAVRADAAAAVRMADAGASRPPRRFA